MTKYLVSREDLGRLLNGELPIEEISNSENRAVSTWSGADIMLILDEIGNVTTEEEEQVIDKVSEIISSNSGDEIFTQTEKTLSSIRAKAKKVRK